MENNLRFRRTTVDNLTWTGISPSMTCSTLAITNPAGVNLKLRTDPDNANSERIVPPLGSQEIRFTRLGRAISTGILVYAQFASGTSYVILDEVA